MKLSISYKHVESHKPVEVEVERHVGKTGETAEELLAGPRAIARHYFPSIHARTRVLAR